MTQTLYIIDGHAQIYRAYYAVSGLSSDSGEPTNATFGFISMFLKLLEVRRPSHVTLAMDAGSSNRELVDSQYKAQRKPMPEDMPAQIDRINRMMQLIGVPVQRVKDFEADDVIATIARRMNRDPALNAIPVYICSRDKDLDQLINDSTFLFDIQENTAIDAATLLAKKGYRPEQAADVLALTGDTADNIQGIPGVGPKTAAKWIAQFGSIDALREQAHAIPGKIGESLRANFNVLDMSRKLVQLQFDVPVNFSWPLCRFDPASLTRWIPIFEELNFRKLLPQLQRVQSILTGQVVESVNTSPLPAPRMHKPGIKTPSPPEINLFNQLPQDTPETTNRQESLAAAVNPVDVPPQSTESLAPVKGDYQLVNSPEALEAMVRDLVAMLTDSPHHWLSVDTETDALGAMKSNICGISLSTRVGIGWYVAIHGSGQCVSLDLVRKHLGPILADPMVKKIGQNLKYDLNVLRRCNLPLAGIFMDTMVADYLLDSSRTSHSMDAMAADYLGLKPIPISDLIGKGAQQKSFAQVPLDIATTYAAEDADVTLRLAEVLFPRLHADGMDKLLFEMEMPLVSVLADMEYVGVKVDVTLLKDLSRDIDHKLVDLKLRIRQAAGTEFNFDSPKQLGEILFQRLGLPVVKKTKTGPSTDIGVLEALSDAHPVPALILEYRQLTKLQGTYLEALIAGASLHTGRVHANFNQTVTETGRLSSSDPNLQNIPIRTDIGREIREAFVAQNDDYLLISADYSQIELRMLAHFCREPALIEAFGANQDIHAFVAAQIHGVSIEQVTPEMRRVAKSVNFGIIYGQTSYGLSKLLKITEREASAFINAYKRRFPAIEVFTQTCTDQAVSLGYVTTIMGRRRRIPQVKSTNHAIRQFGQRAAINSVVQGSAADLIKLAMVRIHEKIRDRSDSIRLILQIHDELVFECRREYLEEYSAMIRHEMENAIQLAVPPRVDLASGPNWLSAK